ncbi:hypothetical protein A2U01_0058503, partial [Trifolium medium]|nr:hypothetical protein [Trifolium medium]
MSKPAASITTIFCGAIQKNNPNPAHKRHKTHPKIGSIKRPTLGFSDSELVKGTPNADLPLLITATMVKHNISKVLVNQGSSCNIMYQNLFSKVRNQIPELQPYHDGPLTAFDGTTTRSLGFT